MLQEMERLIAEKRMARAELDTDIQALERAKDILAKDAKKTPTLPFTVEPPLRTRGRKVSGDSQVGMAIEIIRQNKEAMYLDDLVAELHKRGKTEVKKISIGSTLAKLAKRGKTFYRANKPNTFGLLEFRGKPNGQADTRLHA